MTADGEAYKKGYLEQAGKKLFIPRTQDGSVDISTINAARALEERFKDLPEFIGAVARGSRMRGYGSETSDKDTALLFSRLSDGQAREQGIDKLDNSVMVANLDPVIEKMDGMLKDGKGSLSFYEYEILAMLCEPAAGKGIKKYREVVGQRLRMFPSSDMEYIIRDIVTQLTTFDSKRVVHVEERVLNEDMKRAQVAAYLQNRSALWDRRVRSIYNLKS